jgi:23S rRNA (guanine1835-N2)-methyltransferase
MYNAELYLPSLLLNNKAMSLFIPTLEQLRLNRYPKSGDKSLRAWSAADELLLAEFESIYRSQNTNSENTNINLLILNDQFGALSVALEQFSPFYWTDSFLSQQALEINATDNQLSAATFYEAILPNLNQNELNHAEFGHSRLVDAIESPNASDTKNTISAETQAKTSSKTQAERLKFDYILIRIPKHNSLLKLQLSQLKRFCHDKTHIIAAGMTKEIHNSNIQLFERFIGSTKTSLAKKKARLVIPKLDLKSFCQSEDSTNDNQSQLLSRYKLDSSAIELVAFPGVFSRKSIDIGSQVLLNYLPELKPKQKVIDLGCGNGLLAAVLAKQNPSCDFLLTDESRLAIESAKLTFYHNRLTQAKFVQTDVLLNIEHYDYDHIICNPPFHQQNVQTLAIATNMFKQSAAHLKPSGELRVVANRHLKYLPILKRYFKLVVSISQDAKFTVWLATQPKKDNRS